MTARTLAALFAVVAGLGVLLVWVLPSHDKPPQSESSIEVSPEADSADEPPAQGSSELPRPLDESKILVKTNDAFKSLDEATLSRIQPFAEQRFFDDGPPELYIRHRLVEVDTELLRNQIESAWLTQAEGNTDVSIKIPLFDDYVIDVRVTDWIVGSGGLTSAYGSVQAQDAPLDSFVIHISDLGRLEASFIPGQEAFIISDVLDYKYYIVMQTERNPVID